MLNNCLCVVSVCVCIHSYLITWSQSPLCPLSSYPESDKEETAGLGAPSTCCPYWHQISSLHNGLFSYLLFGYDTAENAEWRQHAAHSPIIRKQLNTICCLGVSLFSLVPLRLLSFPVYSVWMSYSMFVHSYRHDSLKKERKLSALSLQDPKVFPDSSEKNSSARCSQQKPPCEDTEGCMQMFEFFHPDMQRIRPSSLFYLLTCQKENGKHHWLIGCNYNPDTGYLHSHCWWLAAEL